MQFHLVPAFKQKPLYNKPITPAAKPDPFGDPEPDFIVANTEHHILQLNKFCAVCPQLLLHPKKYAPQAESLEHGDFAAACDVLERLGKTQYVAFYNCRIESGSSQAYRHIQIIPRPDPEEFLLFPDKWTGLAKLKHPCEPPLEMAIPFRCLGVGIVDKSVDEMFTVYSEMLKSLESALGLAPVAHNVIFTSNWLVVIPRRRARVGICAANAMGMIGMIWVASAEEREGWNSLRLSKNLSELGY
jgi:ATP adenylyltransferase/5',5'''-P-1,P-4-tetraphosphate phosphorylase II